MKLEWMLNFVKCLSITMRLDHKIFLLESIKMVNPIINILKSNPLVSLDQITYGHWGGDFVGSVFTVVIIRIFFSLFFFLSYSKVIK
jgi:hypothetical protein